MALGEALEPWESAEVGVDVVMYHLEAARTIAHHGGIYRTNAETKLQGKHDLLQICVVLMMFLFVWRNLFLSLGRSGIWQVHHFGGQRLLDGLPFCTDM